MLWSPPLSWIEPVVFLREIASHECARHHWVTAACGLLMGCSWLPYIQHCCFEHLDMVPLLSFV